MCDWAVRTDKAGRQDWESNYQHYSDIGPISFFFFFFKLWYLAENKREKIAFPIYSYWGRCKTPYLHCLMTFDVWFWRQKSSNEKWEKCQDSHNGHKPTVYNEFSLISRHFCHHFTRFSLISQSILNRFSCNFAGTTCNYSGDCPEKLVKFWASTSKVISEITGKFAWVFQNLFI